MRARLGLAAALVVAAVVVVVLLGGGSDSRAGSGTVLSWNEDPVSLTNPNLPDDRIAYGDVRNVGMDGITANAGDFDVRDARGKPLDASVQFLGTFAHGLYGAFQQPARSTPFEKRRLGKAVAVKPGEVKPLTVAYHLDPSTELPASVYYAGSRVLTLPAESVDPASLATEPAG